MRNYKLKAFILKMRNLSEKDKVLVIFSIEKGKISLKAKGLSNIKSKLKGHLIPFSLVNLEVAKGKGDLDVITSSQNINTFEKTKSDLSKISIAYYASEVINSLTIENQKNSELFDLIDSFFQILEKINVKNKDDLLIVSFLFKLISLQGHGPKIETCVVCDQNYEKDKEVYFFDLEHGGILCQNCKEHKVHSLEISIEMLRVINALTKLQFEEAINLNIPLSISKETKEIIQKFNRYIFHKEFKSEDFLNKVKEL